MRPAFETTRQAALYLLLLLGLLFAPWLTWLTIPGIYREIRRRASAIAMIRAGWPGRRARSVAVAVSRAGRPVESRWSASPIWVRISSVSVPILRSAAVWLVWTRDLWVELRKWVIARRRGVCLGVCVRAGQGRVGGAGCWSRMSLMATGVSHVGQRPPRSTRVQGWWQSWQYCWAR